MAWEFGTALPDEEVVFVADAGRKVSLLRRHERQRSGRTFSG